MKDRLTLQPWPCSPCYIWLSAPASRCTRPTSASAEAPADGRPDGRKGTDRDGATAKGHVKKEEKDERGSRINEKRRKKNVSRRNPFDSWCQQC